MYSTLIAVAVTEQGAISPHAGRALHWQVYVATEKKPLPVLGWTISLTDEGCLHEWHVREDNERHPLHHVDIAIAGSGGEGVKRRLQERSTRLVDTSESDPLQAVTHFLQGELSPGKGHEEESCLNPEHHKAKLD